MRNRAVVMRDAGISRFGRKREKAWKKLSLNTEWSRLVCPVLMTHVTEQKEVQEAAEVQGQPTAANANQHCEFQQLNIVSEQRFIY